MISESGERSAVGRALGREQRLRASADFTATLRKGVRKRFEHFTVYYRRTRRGYARLGLGISRRVARKATRRNRIKRSLREAFRARRDELPSIDVVVLATAACGMLSNNRLNEAAAAVIADLIVDVRSP